MPLTEEQLELYLASIQLSHEDIEHCDHKELLSKIQLQHSQYLPFANLDVFIPNGPVSLELAEIFEKIVVRNRGGYCFEQNTLLYHVFQTLGFNAEIQAARVILEHKAPEKIDSALTHIFVIVSHPKDTKDLCYVIDVGFGGYGPIKPLQLGWNESTIIHGSIYTFRQRVINTSVIKKTRVMWQLVYHEETDPDNSLILYEFDVCREFTFPDMELANFWVSTSPDSIFVNNLFISGVLVRPDGEVERISLWNLRKSKTLLTSNEKSFQYLDTPEELLETLSLLNLRTNLDSCKKYCEKVKLLSQNESETPVNT